MAAVVAPVPETGPGAPGNGRVWHLVGTKPNQDRDDDDDDVLLVKKKHKNS